MGGSARRWLGTEDRFARLHVIETLDPKADWLKISRLFYGDFSSIMMPLPFSGFMTTFASPRMSRILSMAGELEHRFAKRAVDTMLFSRMFTAEGPGSKTGREAARRVNALHRMYDIHPDDFVLVGCDPCVYAIELAERHGWRDVTDKEREALRHFYNAEARAFGSRMPVPATVSDMQAFVSHYFDTQLKFEPQNLRMATTCVNWFADLAPRPLRPVMRSALPALIDPRVVEACGLPRPSATARALGGLIMKFLSRRDPVPDGAPDMLEPLARSVYPNGWTVEMLGPQHEAAKRALGDLDHVDTTQSDRDSPPGSAFAAQSRGAAEGPGRFAGGKAD